MMLPLVFLPLASIFIFGTSNGLDKFWAALMRPKRSSRSSFRWRRVSGPPSST
jgi:hypothetical protein